MNLLQYCSVVVLPDENRFFDVSFSPAVKASRDFKRVYKPNFSGNVLEFSAFSDFYDKSRQSEFVEAAIKC